MPPRRPREWSWRAGSLIAYQAAALMAGLVIVVGACSGAATPAPPIARPTAAQTAVPTDQAAASASGSSPIAPQTSASIPSGTVKPGDPLIVYEWIADSGNGIYLVRPDGTDSHLILPGLHPDWSPDGSRLAFSSDGTTISTSNADGTDVRPLVTCDAPCNFVDFPAWSPDGTHIAFLRDDATKGVYSASAIEIVDFATGSRRTVLETHASDFFEYPRWAPDGRSLVVEVQQYRTGQKITVDGDQPHQAGSVIAVADISGPGLAIPRIITDPAMQATYPDWQPTGDRIVFSTDDLGEWQQTDEPSNLYSIRSNGSGLTQLTRFGRADTRATQPTWTPDGKRIIFTQAGQNAGGAYDLPRRIAFIAADGSDPTVIDGVDATHPRLRPVAATP